MIQYCPICEEVRSFQLINRHINSGIDNVPTEYSFACCEKCREPVVFIREDVGDGFENDSYYRVYPKNERHLGFNLPNLVRQSYEDAIRCENAKIWTATVVMVGKCLEAVCKDSFPGSKTMFDGLKKMRDNGLLSEEILEWSNELRVLRNYGAHALDEKIMSIDAIESIDFLQAILEILYNLRPKFDEMKKRRASAK